MTPKSSLPSVSIFEAETMLSDAMALLKKAANLEPIKDTIVGDYWEDTWRRAPFEECMTFKQLASIQFDNLIRKKSLDCEKMVALAFAIRKALNLGKPNPQTQQSSATRPAPTLPENTGLSATGLALYIGLKDLVYALPEGHSLRVAAIKSIEGVEPLGFLAAWLAALHDPETVMAVTGTKKATLQSCQKKAVQKIASIFHYAAPECYLHWSTALTGAGASTKHLVDPYLYAKGVHKDVIEGLCLLFLKAIGASPVEYKKGVIPNHYSLTPKTAQKILSALKFPAKASRTQLAQILSLPFPFFDIEELIPLLKR